MRRGEDTIRRKWGGAVLAECMPVQVLDEIQDVLESEDEAHGGRPHALPSSSEQGAGEASAARVERLRENLEKMLGFDRFCNVYK